jgi:two-component sensor histidine kinase
VTIALDIHTIFSLLIAVCVLGAILLAIDIRKGATIFDAAFIAGLGLQAVSWTFISLRGVAPDLLTFSLGNSLQFAGMALLGLGLLSLKTGIGRPWAVAYSVALLLILGLWLFPGLDQKTHIVLISAVYPFFFTVPGWFMMSGKRGSSPLQRFLGVALVLYSAGMLFRGISLALGGKYDLFSHSALQILVIFSFILVMNLVILGYILMKKEIANERLKELSDARNLLLTELQHRIKNSLAIISSLTNLEVELHADSALKGAMQKIRDRIRAVAELYNLLLVETPTRGVFVDAYLRDIVDHLREGYATVFDRVSIHLDLEHVEIDAKTSVSIGLIINELVTNAFKYAFPEGRPGSIGIRFSKDGDRLALVVEDDGIGMETEPNGLGTLIVSTLANQIGGELSRERDGGTRVEIVFKEPVSPSEKSHSRPIPKG